MSSTGPCPACDEPAATLFPGGFDKRVECPSCGELFVAYEAELDDARSMVAGRDGAGAVAIAGRVLEAALAGGGAGDGPLYERMLERLGERATPGLRFRMAGTARILERFARPGGSGTATVEEAKLVIGVVDAILAP